MAKKKSKKNFEKSKFGFLFFLLLRLFFFFFFVLERNFKDDSSDSDTMSNDASSVTSGFSCVSIRCEPDEPPTVTPAKDDDVDEGVSEIDDFESKLDLVLDGLQNTKSCKTRMGYYESLSKAFVLRFCFDCLDTRFVCLLDLFFRG